MGIIVGTMIDSNLKSIWAPENCHKAMSTFTRYAAYFDFPMIQRPLHASVVYHGELQKSNKTNKIFPFWSQLAA